MPAQIIPFKFRKTSEPVKLASFRELLNTAFELGLVLSCKQVSDNAYDVAFLLPNNPKQAWIYNIAERDLHFQLNGLLMGYAIANGW